MKSHLKIFLPLIALIFLSACSKEKRFMEVDSPYSVGETIQKLTQVINEKKLTVFQVINHDENALKAGMEILPTKLIIFGNPQIGTKLMLEDRTAAIELPMKMLVYEKEDGSVKIGYNPVGSLISSYQLDSQVELLGKIDQNLAGIIQQAIGKKKEE